MRLVKITKNLLPKFRDFFQAKWPTHVPSYGAIQHFIERFEKHSEWEEKVSFFKLKDDSESDGTFAVVYGPYIYFDTLETAPYPKLENLLYNLELEDNQAFVNIKDQYRPLMDNIMRIKNLEKFFEIGNKIVYFDIDEEYLLSVRTGAPEGFQYDSLKPQDIDTVLSTIPNPTQRCIDYMKTVIKYNATTGLYKDDGQLIAWIVTHELGMLGNVSVRPEFQKRQYGNMIVPEHGLREIRTGRVIFGDIGHYNYKSFNLMAKFRGQLLENISSIGFRKKPTPYYFPSWYHF